MRDVRPTAACPSAAPSVPDAVGVAGRHRRTVPSEALLGDARELCIEHQGEQYVLRLTRLGKLILTK